MNEIKKKQESLPSKNRITKLLRVKIVDYPKDVEESYKKKHSLLGLVVNCIMLTATLFAGFVAFRVYRESQTQTIEAKKATEIAKEALKYTIENNDRVYTLQKEQIIQAKKDAGSQFLLQQKSVDAQIASLQEAQKQFLKDNQPVLEMTNFDSLNINTDTGLITFKYNICNYGKRAVQLRSISSAMWVPNKVGESFNGSALEGQLNKSNLALAYISPSKPFKLDFTGVKIISPEILKEFLDTRSNFYFMERITYHNYINNREMVYDFIIKMYFSKKLLWDYVLNKNYDPKIESFVMP